MLMLCLHTWTANGLNWQPMSLEGADGRVIAAHYVSPILNDEKGELFHTQDFFNTVKAEGLRGSPS